MPADLARVADLGDDIRAACEEAGLDEMARMDLELALVEAANNIVVHGYGGDLAKDYVASFVAAPGMVEIMLEDRGTPIPADMIERSEEICPDAEHGRGIMIIRQCVDEFLYSSNDGENRLTLRKRACS